MLELPTEPGNEGAFRIDEQRPEPGIALLVVHGDVDLHGAPELRERLRAAVAAGASAVVVDLADTSLLDSTALGVLLGVSKELRDHEGELQLVVSRPEIRRIFEITLLDQIFALHETRAEALAAVDPASYRASSSDA